MCWASSQNSLKLPKVFSGEGSNSSWPPRPPMTWLLFTSLTSSLPTPPWLWSGSHTSDLQARGASSYLRAFSGALPGAWNALQRVLSGWSLHLTKVLVQTLLSSTEPSLATLSKTASPVTLHTFDPALLLCGTFIIRWDIIIYRFTVYLPYENVLHYAMRTDSALCTVWTVPYTADNNKDFLNEQINLFRPH